MRAKRRLAAEGNTQPTARELARRSGIPHQKVEQILALPGEPVSLDAPINGEADLILGDTIASDAQPLPEDAASAEERRARVLALVETLDPRERQVVTLRFGLDGSKDRTLEEVGEVLSLTRERIRQIESLALNKLKARCARSGFTFDLEK